MKMTTLCYIEKDGKYLMLHRTKKRHDINKDKWIGVGGQAVLRSFRAFCNQKEADSLSAFSGCGKKCREIQAAHVLYCTGPVLKCGP